jgi:D-Tyr-tRNAtyr deacylase
VHQEGEEAGSLKRIRRDILKAAGLREQWVGREAAIRLASNCMGVALVNDGPVTVLLEV